MRRTVASSAFSWFDSLKKHVWAWNLGGGAGANPGWLVFPNSVNTPISKSA
jgi:hypothetical protein